MGGEAGASQAGSPPRDLDHPARGGVRTELCEGRPGRTCGVTGRHGSHGDPSTPTWALLPELLPWFVFLTVGGLQGSCWGDGAVKTPIRAEGGDSVRLAEKCQSQLPGPCHGGGAPEERPLVQDEGWARAPCPRGRPRCWASRAQARAPPEVGRGDRDKMSPSHSERWEPPSQTAPAPRCRPD